jgi:uncharacterized protein (TIGR03083 family)
MERAAPSRPDSTADLLALREQATTALLEQLDRLDDPEPRLSWWPPERTVGFTRRMQIHDATMHRVDAELTAAVPVSPIGPDVAAGAVDHAVDVMWGWLPAGSTYQAGAGIEFVGTDVDRQWLVEVGRSTKEPSATVRAPIGDVALWVWTRGGAVEVSGDAESVAAVDAVVTNGMQ